MTDGDMRRPAGGALALPAIAGWVFMAAGAVMVAGGVVLAFDDPGGFALVAFGLVFGGAGWLARRVFAVPAGKRAVAVAAHEVGIRSVDGRRGTRRQATIIHVDEDAGEVEVEAAKSAWLRAQWQARPDWVAGCILAEDARSGGWLGIGAGLWTAFALGAAGAGWLMGEPIVWLGAGGAGLVATGLCVAAVLAALRRRMYGVSHCRLDRTPAALGERLTGTVETGIARARPPRDGFRLSLQCVHRWEETRGTGSDRRTHHRREVLWQDERREPGRVGARSPQVMVPLDFALPADQPATSLGGGSEGIAWELAVTAAMPGLDYRATFTLPVLPPGALDAAAAA